MTGMGQEAPTMDKWDQKDDEQRGEQGLCNYVPYDVVVIPCNYIAGEYGIYF